MSSFSPPIRRAILDFNTSKVTEEDDDKKRDKERHTEREREVGFPLQTRK